MATDTILFLVIGILSVFMAVLGGMVASSEPWVRAAFIVMGIVSVVCILWEGKRLQAPATPAQIASELAPLLGGRNNGTAPPPQSASAREIAEEVISKLPKPQQHKTPDNNRCELSPAFTYSSLREQANHMQAITGNWIGKDTNLSSQEYIQRNNALEKNKVIQQRQEFRTDTILSALAVLRDGVQLKKQAICLLGKETPEDKDEDTQMEEALNGDPNKLQPVFGRPFAIYFLNLAERLKPLFKAVY